MVQDAAIRNFEIIGEATKQLSQAAKEKHPEVAWREVAGFRDVLIHNYMGVNPRRVWNTVEQNLPELRGVVEEMLWPDKSSREDFEIKLFIDAYKQRNPGRDLRIVQKRDRPDFFVADTKTGDEFGVETTSVYENNRSVPDIHEKPSEGLEEIPYDKAKLDAYLDRLAAKVEEKKTEASHGYDLTRPLTLSVYLNEYISIHLTKKHLKEMVDKHKAVFGDIAPFRNVVFGPMATSLDDAEEGPGQEDQFVWVTALLGQK
jgi:hypothetical protein